MIAKSSPEGLPPLERIGWLVAAGHGYGEDGTCADCGAEPDRDDVTEHEDYCGLAAALVAYYAFRHAEQGRGLRLEDRRPSALRMVADAGGANWCERIVDTYNGKPCRNACRAPERVHLGGDWCLPCVAADALGLPPHKADLP